MKLHFEYDRRYLPSAPVIPITIDGYSTDADPITVQALIDSGADGTMLPSRILRRIGASFVDSVHMSGVSGISQSIDQFLVRITIGDTVIGGIEALSVSNQMEAIIGRDVLNQLVVVLDGLASEITISD
ncbi:MAG: putative aspartyl protease [Cellvibrionaceae bacterium]|jgi:predicted aspartyl protease